MSNRRFTINHIGIAVPSLDRFLKAQRVLLGDFDRGPVIPNPTQRVNEMFLTDGKVVLELLEPSSPSSPIQGYLGRNPSGGLLHLAVDVDDIDQAIAELKACGGVVAVKPTPDVAFANRRICFVVIDGQVTELIERPKP